MPWHPTAAWLPGDSRDEALALIREAIQFHIEGLREEGLPVPEPARESEVVEVGADNSPQHPTAGRFARLRRLSGKLMTTWEKMQEWAAAGALTEIEVVTRDLVSEGDRVVAHTFFRATHGGELLGVSGTGRRFEFHSLEMWRVEDGKLVEHRGGLRETVRLYEQLT